MDISVKPSEQLTADEFSALLEAAADAMIVIDETGIIERFNRAAESTFGYTSEEVVGQNVKMLMPEPDKSQHDGYLQHHLQTGEQRIIGIGREILARRHDGSHFPADLSVGRVNATDKVRFVGILRDTSEKHAFEAEISKQRQELSRISRQATAGELAAALAHELNQPLTAIATYGGAAKRFLQRVTNDAQTAHAQASLTEVHTALTHIETQSLRAGEVIQRMRAFIRPEETERDRVRVGDIVGEILSIAQLDARAEGVLFTHNSENPDQVLDVDKIQIQQVLLNLVRNAVDATSSVPSETPQVTLSVTSTHPTRVKFSVQDTGPGIKSEFVEELFTPFKSTKSDGLGMGLAISRSIVESHGSKLEFVNTPEGCTFYFSLWV